MHGCTSQQRLTTTKANSSLWTRGLNTESAAQTKSTVYFLKPTERSLLQKRAQLPQSIIPHRLLVYFNKATVQIFSSVFGCSLHRPMFCLFFFWNVGESAQITFCHAQSHSTVDEHNSYLLPHLAKTGNHNTPPHPSMTPSPSIPPPRSAEENPGKHSLRGATLLLQAYMERVEAQKPPF